MLISLLTALYQLALFIFYFIYFLFKGKPEWKKIDDIRNSWESSRCCLHNQNVDACKSFHLKDDKYKSSSFGASPQPTKFDIPTRPQSSGGTKPPQPSGGTRPPQRSGVRSFFQKISQVFYILGHAVFVVISFFFNLIIWLFVTVFGVFFRRSRTKREDVAQNLQSSFNEENVADFPKPFEEAPTGQGESAEEKIRAFAEQSAKAQADQLESEEAFDVVKKSRFVYQYESSEDKIPQSSDIPTAPPAPPTFPAWKITVTSSEKTKVTDEVTDETMTAEKVPPGGVAVLPPEITAEASWRIKEREKKLEEQRKEEKIIDSSADDWTVTSTKKVSEIKSQIPEVLPKDYHSITEQPSSQQQPVSHDFQYYKYNDIFAKPQRSEQQVLADTRQQDYKTSAPLGDDTFFMGRSVFSPVREAEELRTTINRRAMRSDSVQRVETPSTTESYYNYNRPFTPYDYVSQSSRSVTPYETEMPRRLQNMSMSYYTQRSRPTHRMIRSYIYPPSTQEPAPYGTESQTSSYLRHRSHTTEPRSSSAVRTISRQWPPQSNATGAEVIKDNWNIIPSNLTSCKRVMEKTVTDRWTTRDDTGKLVDDYSERRWKGESDGLRYRPDGTGEAWHRSVSVDPAGRTAFVDNRSHFNRDYVIQSEVRNA